MKITYTQRHDVMYIQLTDKPYSRTRKVNESVILDLDMDVQRIGINPLTMIYEQITEEYGGADLTSEQQEERRKILADRAQTTSSEK